MNTDATLNRKETPMTYNATAYTFDDTDTLAGVEAVTLDSEGRVVRACGHWSHRNGTPEFEAEWLMAHMSFETQVCVVADGAQGYRDRIAGLALPPAYSVA